MQDDPARLQRHSEVGQELTIRVVNDDAIIDSNVDRVVTHRQCRPFSTRAEVALPQDFAVRRETTDYYAFVGRWVAITRCVDASVAHCEPRDSSVLVGNIRPQEIAVVIKLLYQRIERALDIRKTGAVHTVRIRGDEDDLATGHRPAPPQLPTIGTELDQ
jgi:hypothetical protein